MTTKAAPARARDQWNEMSRPLAAALTAALLLTAGGVPLAQALWEVKRGLDNGAAGADLWPRSLNVSSLLPRFGRPRAGSPSSEDSLLGRMLGWLPPVDDLRAFEDDLEAESFLRHTVVPLAQDPLVRLGAGNEQVYIGRGGWLFYRQDVDHLTGPAFLAGGRDPSASDPVSTLVDLRRQLRDRGAELLVVPVPVKPSIHPERLSLRFSEAKDPVRNPSFPRFVEELTEANVPVLDLAPAFMALKGRGEPLYLATDTHWRPETVRVAAAEIARWIHREHPGLVGPEAPGAQLPELRVVNLGDTARMLNLPAEQRLYPREAAVLHPVEPVRNGLAPSESAPVLLLGDSFSNIYSMQGMGWGRDAGLADHLRRESGLRIESIALNDGGALATRAALARRAARNPNLLRATRLVIYQFAARELSHGDWRVIEIP